MMATTTWRQVWRRATLAGLAGAVLLAGACSSGTNSERADSKSSGGDTGAIGGQNPNAVPAGGNPDTDQQKVNALAVRSIIFTGEITVKVKDVTAAAEQVKQRAEAAGGYIGSDRRSSAEASTATATIVVRVPSARFGDTVAAMAGLGTEVGRQFSQDDVTAQVIDLDARIATQQAGLDRIRELIKTAGSTTEMLSIDQELTRREADLAALQAQRDRLNDLVSLSTLTVNLYGPDATPKPAKSERGFLAGLKNGWKAFLASIQVLVTVLGALLPFAIAIGAPIWLLVWWSRRRRANRPLTPVLAPAHPAYGTTPPPPPPPPTDT